MTHGPDDTPRPAPDDPAAAAAADRALTDLDRALALLPAAAPAATAAATDTEDR